MSYLSKTISASLFLLLCAWTLPASAAAPVTVSGSVKGSSAVTVENLLGGSGSGHAVISNVQISPAQHLTVSEAAKAAASAKTTLPPSDPGVSLSLTRGNVAKQATTTASSTITSSNKVTTKSDLGIYVSNLISHEARVRAVDISQSAITLSYAEPAKLFGFIPMQMTAKASVDAAGDVSIKYPWYHSFVKALNTENIRTDIEAHTKLMLKNTGSATATSSASAASHLTVRQQAQLLDQLRVALENNANVAVGVGQ